ncbi:hypothetical protein K2173_006821 [Erythroxylum novogranatense]|uniref:Uncharacterized protein n=1 Tax=Erythroxylum novogranatense TaxID=1862640 RepID=A0AAV8SYT2_9ROSI|nr:hypothetical protein K2173_006821 [Erythroxylum novogranatense]
MAFLFNKFQEAVKTLANSPTFARNPRQLQFETDINRLFLYTSYNRLGRDAEEADTEEIIDMASKASVSDQQKQVHENVHYQIQHFCKSMDEILLIKKPDEASAVSPGASRSSGLSFAVGKSGPPINSPVIPETAPLNRAEVSQRLKNLLGYTLDLKPSLIAHKEAGQGLFLNGGADVGTVIAFYPGVIYSPAYYQYIPGYPRVDAQNPYLITRYDGTVINAQPWGSGDDTREVWDGFKVPEIKSNVPSNEKGADRIWKVLSRPLEGTQVNCTTDVLERRNPLALAHFSNHPAKGILPNVMICPYDFPLNDNDMRAYIPNIPFGNPEEVNMRRFGSFWFRSGRKNGDSGIPVLKTLVLVATRELCDEEVLLNYRLSNSKRRPAWYTPVDEDEDRRRWS